MPVFQLTEDWIFPDPRLADASGLLAVGGGLETGRLLIAYQLGIFPWFNPGEPPLWWSPDPRMVLYPSELKISKSMRQVIRNKKFEVTANLDFPGVIKACRDQERPEQEGTWITDEMLEAYIELHHLGWAHSIEVWREKQLVGGLYGLAMGKCFFGESMFTLESNASKTGFIALVQQLEKLGFDMIDCQIKTSHLESLGAREISRNQFLNELEHGIQEMNPLTDWSSFE